MTELKHYVPHTHRVLKTGRCRESLIISVSTVVATLIAVVATLIVVVTILIVVVATLIAVWNNHNLFFSIKMVIGICRYCFVAAVFAAAVPLLKPCILIYNFLERIVFMASEIFWVCFFIFMGLLNYWFFGCRYFSWGEKEAWPEERSKILFLCLCI